MIHSLKQKVMGKCSTFEALVSHIWRARTKAMFCNKNEYSTVLFAVDIRSKLSSPLGEGFVGNAVVTAFATAKVGDLVEKPLSFGVEKIRKGKERVNEDYVRSVIDWLEVYKGIPATCNGNFYVSAWWKLSFEELDFGFGKAVYGGPLVGGNDEFVLLLSDASGTGVNVWIGLDDENMKKFEKYVLEI